MWRTTFLFLVSASWPGASLPAGLPTRPVYGGSLHVQIREALSTYDPLDTPSDASERAAKDRLLGSLFDRLVRLDDRGRPQPALAASWQTFEGAKRWRFRLRAGVKLHDGSLLTAQTVAGSLESARDGWSITAAGDSVQIQSDTAMPDLLLDLAEPRRSIVHRSEDGRIQGSGPFRVSEWVPRRGATLAAHDGYWDGRPFLDGVVLEMGRSLREQLVALEVGRADLVQVAPGEARRLAQRAIRLLSSPPSALIALVFERGRPAAEDIRVRQAVAYAIDRAPIHNVLLQKQGDLAGGLLPQWLSGFAFLFQPVRDTARARQLASPLSGAGLTMSTDAADPLLRAIADRVALDTRDAGITIQASQASQADLRLVQLPIRSADPRRALSELATLLPRPERWQLTHEGGAEQIYAAERSLLEEYRVIPLFHIPVITGAGSKVKTWNTSGISKTGGWFLEDFWLDMVMP
jgi:ABC-type oligopeptide transport system substrate-binding subunit